eukprot:TRINITY_DN65804_c0_g1_i1.p2 TRINITY_DN65804_c0_g1~~TRINITY_DN65804_c0_g1_i1.p2  ORF type:complete len:219 (-),score=48.64 TRINITY_DN65804_c0_g1_i1:7-663(-)
MWYIVILWSRWIFFFFSSRRRHTRCREVSWARRCVQETALITALTAIITVIGSIYVNQSISAENTRNQRLVEIRKMKQDYYHRFTESFMLRMAYILNQNSTEFKEADKTFCIEKNRLPLYASQEIVEYVDEVASGKNLTADFKTLFELIRKDLNDDTSVSYTHLTLPTILLVQISVVAVSLKKKKKKQNSISEQKLTRSCKQAIQNNTYIRVENKYIH